MVLLYRNEFTQSKKGVVGLGFIWISVGQGPTVLAIGAGRSCFVFFVFLFSFSLSLGDDPVYTEIPSQRAIKSKKANQQILRM